MKYVRAAAEGIGQYHSREFMVVVNKSTVPIGSGNWVDSIVRDAYLAHHAGEKADGKFAGIPFEALLWLFVDPFPPTSIQPYILNWLLF